MGSTRSSRPTAQCMSGTAGGPFYMYLVCENKFPILIIVMP